MNGTKVPESQLTLSNRLRTVRLILVGQICFDDRCAKLKMFDIVDVSEALLVGIIYTRFV